MNESGFFIGLGLFFLVACGLADSCQRHNACKDAPLAGGCTHPDHRFTIVEGAKMCLCARDKSTNSSVSVGVVVDVKADGGAR